MPQNEHARPVFGNDLPPDHRDNLEVCRQMGIRGDYTDSEIKLFRVVALAYADPRRLSIRDLHKLLLEMIDRDDELTGMPSNRPSLAAFRRLVLTLPADFVDVHRYGSRLTSRHISMTAEQVTDDIWPKRLHARN